MGLGIIVLLFVAYELWATGFQQHHTQAVLRGQLARSLPPKTASLGSRPWTTQLIRAQPTPKTGQADGDIQIPKIGVNEVFVQGVETADLQEGPGHYPGTPLPGQAGNAAIAGHRTTWGAPFNHLNALRSGDLIYVTSPAGEFRYRVNRIFSVLPSDGAVLDVTTVPSLTLTTCDPPYSASQRLIVRATLTGVRTPVTRIASVPTRNASVAPRTLAKRPATRSAVDWLRIALSLALLAIALGGWSVAGRTLARSRYAIYGGVVAVALGGLLLLFGAIGPLLPADF